MNLEYMQRSARQASEFLRSLGNEHRLMMLCLMTEGEISVGELAATLGMRQAGASQQLAVLRREGLVKTRRDGQTVYYRLADERIRRVIEQIYRAFCESGICAPSPVQTEDEADKGHRANRPAAEKP